MKRDHFVFGVHVTDRMKRAQEVQQIFSDHGHAIRTRVGLHDVSADRCAPGGLILLEMVGSEEDMDRMASKLGAIEGIEVQKMVFRHG